ncbi:MAG: ATP-binding protein [Anaerolineae bacterium]
MDNLDWVLHQDEGQFFERKSCYEHTAEGLRRRDVRAVAWDVTETLAAIANADGGILALGLEDDGTVTGVDYPEDRLEVLRRAPRTHVRPPLKVRLHQAELQGRSIVLFETDWSPEVHQLTDGRYLLRIGDSNMPFPADQIEAVKAGKRRRVTEARFVPEASLADLDESLLAELRDRAGLALPAEKLLLHYRLAEPRNGRLVLSLATLLLFGKDPGRWHPRCGIDFVKYEGTERRFGAQLNIVKRQWLEAPLVRLIETAYRAIEPHIRERQRLVDLFFEERLEYPTFAWQEAIVNAVAHRDYGYEGVGIEVWMFDDHVEVRSPGELVEPVTLERLRRRERIHAARNPRITRVLTAWEYMRELGEGIPRMFEAMEREGLYPPELKLEAGVIFTVVLRNTPVYGPETARWLKQFEPLDLSGNQKRLLAYAREHDGTFTSRAYQRLAGVDLYTASRDIKDLIRKGIVRLIKKGGRVYRVIEHDVRTTEMPLPDQFLQIEPFLGKQGYVKNEDVRRILGISRTRAKRLLEEWVAAGLLRLQGKGRGSQYVPFRNGSVSLGNGSAW